MSWYAHAAQGGALVNLAEEEGGFPGGLAIALVFLAIMVACLTAAYLVKRSAQR
ncbi:hypothetical protein F0L17_12480 [Streptomyces sp. TRM43335]|uniref:Uncharacterized protein n=1 Tax=Streptomyces taklimakanensis TaxID=2569853 RepID=A0A6G2BCD5_9ACTN|nr:hypothetical protein [Streptomyces taklimakanensis]MTE19918.1 hypothetical protein [Streptomyces taklimakanensis]